MRWLLHGTMTSAVGDALQRHGHKASSLTDNGLSPEASPTEVFETARKAQLEVLTTDGALAQAPFEASQPIAGRCMVYLQLEGGDVEQDDAIDRLFARYKRLSPGRLYTVTGSRVKVRQLPSAR
jgi:predicted nuclease of predicted toxin-antitoxin system